MSEYTPGEVSEMLAVPPSTLRRYVATFGDLLSDGTRRKRGRTFSETDLAILHRIRTLTEAGYRLEQVAAQLGEVVAELPLDEPPPSALMLINRVAERQALLAETQAEQQDQLNELRAEIEKLNQRLSERDRSWWQKLFGRK